MHTWCSNSISVSSPASLAYIISLNCVLLASTSRLKLSLFFRDTLSSTFFICGPTDADLVESAGAAAASREHIHTHCLRTALWTKEEEYTHRFFGSDVERSPASIVLERHIRTCRDSCQNSTHKWQHKVYCTAASQRNGGKEPIQA